MWPSAAVKYGLQRQESFYYPLTEEEKENIKTVVKITKKKGYKNKQQVGRVDIYLGNEKIDSVKVYVKIKK